MKRIGYIWEKIIDKENIKTAILLASKHKKKKRIVKKVLDNIDFYVDEIYNMLYNKTYIPSPYLERGVKDNKRKERKISAPRWYPDTCIQWSIMLQLEKVLYRGLYENSCGNIKGRGVSYGKRYIEKVIKRNYKRTKYTLKMDIKKY